MIRYLAFLFILLATVGFFNYHAILVPNAEKLVFYISVITGAIVAYLQGADISKIRYPRRLYSAMLVLIIISAIVCGESHMQSAMVTFKATLPILLGYATFYIFMKLKVPEKKIISTYIGLCAASTIVFFCNMFTLPNNIFGQPVIDEDFSRGIVRVYLVFIEIFPLLVFYGINRYLETKEKKWIVLIAWLSVMIFLSVTRQIIASTAILGLWFFFRKISLTKKIVAVCVVLFTVAVVLPQIPVYKTMIELSEDQRDDNGEEENVRIKAWRYYTYENQPNALTPLFGNGVPSLGNSTWGVQFDSDTDVTGCFAADVGWAGFFYYFGIFTTICLLLLLLGALFKKKPFSHQYTNYWLIFIILTAVASGPILYYYQIVSICVVLYIVYGAAPGKKDISTSDFTDENHRSDNTELQQRRRYPQLR